MGLNPTNSRIVYAIPSANPKQCGETFARWKALGYSTAVLLNGPEHQANVGNADHIFREPDYRGWGASVNWLCRNLDFEWLVTGGCDMWPPPEHCAGDIAAECLKHFNGTMGVMQGCGDRWLNNSDKICGSPWIGAEFARRWNAGVGPFWPEYFHHYADNELHDTALMHDLLWNRPDLTILHQHYKRPECRREMPDYMQRAYAMDGVDRAVYKQRKALHFPGHEPCQQLQNST